MRRLLAFLRDAAIIAVAFVFAMVGGRQDPEGGRR